MNVYSVTVGNSEELETGKVIVAAPSPERAQQLAEIHSGHQWGPMTAGETKHLHTLTHSGEEGIIESEFSRLW
jgi:hypothetical protein